MTKLLKCKEKICPLNSKDKNGNCHNRFPCWFVIIEKVEFS